MNATNLSQLFENSTLFSENTLDMLQILLSLSMTFLMAMFIYFVYKRTYNGVLYSQNFNITLVMTAIAINAIVIGISGNLMLSLGMVGALSIIRFRTAVKDPRDTAFIFWSIMVGIANGVQYFELSFIASLFIAVVLWGLSRSVTFEPAYMLIIKYPRSTSWAPVQAILDNKAFVSSYLTRSDTLKNEVVERVTEVKIKRGQQESLLDQLRACPSVDHCILLSSNGEFTE
jgi:uncharacterized membrane protein YhiD involved in acid resistance